MKKYLTIAITALLLVAVPQHVNAQAKKASAATVGHINLDSLYNIYPAYNAAMDTAEAYYNQLIRDLTIMQMEYTRKANELDSLSKVLSPFQKQQRERDLQILGQRIQEYQQSAQEDFTKKQTALLTPVFNSIQKAVKEVAIERGYKYILDSSKSTGIVLYAADSEDVFAAVKAKLGIKDPPPTPKPGGTGVPTPPGGH